MDCECVCGQLLSGVQRGRGGACGSYYLFVLFNLDLDERLVDDEMHLKDLGPYPTIASLSLGECTVLDRLTVT